MYVPKHFAETDPASLVAFMRRHGFAMLYTAGPDGPTASHLPLLIEAEAGGEEPGPVRIAGHVARANDHWRAFDGDTQGRRRQVDPFRQFDIGQPSVLLQLDEDSPVDVFQGFVGHKSLILQKKQAVNIDFIRENVAERKDQPAAMR